MLRGVAATAPSVSIPTCNTAWWKAIDLGMEHQRHLPTGIFFVEVMGRDTGFIAMHTGIAAGAEYVLVPERKENVEELTKALLDRSTDKSSSIVVVAEGHHGLHGDHLQPSAEQGEEKLPAVRHPCVGPAPLATRGTATMADRLLASRLGCRSGGRTGEMHYNAIASCTWSGTSWAIAPSRRCCWKWGASSATALLPATRSKRS